MKEDNVVGFCIEIDFKKGTDTPSRVFRTLYEFIEAFQNLDRDLIACVDPKIEPIILLEDIETGSVKTIIRYALNSINDEAIKKLDWKQVIGEYLVQAKYMIIRFLEDKSEIINRDQLAELEKELFRLAKETDINQIPTYSFIPRQKLLKSIGQLNMATSHLTGEDKLIYKTDEDMVVFNPNFRMSEDAIEKLLTQETIKSQMRMILKVKKPDYLGESRWDFKHENRIIQAKILDKEWISSFQTRVVDIRPGDSVKADVQVITHYGYDAEVVSIQFEILKIIDVIIFIPPDQLPLV